MADASLSLDDFLKRRQKQQPDLDEAQKLEGPPPVSERPNVFDEFLERRAAKVRTSIDIGSKFNPEEAAQAQELSAQTGLPVDMVERQPAAVKQAEEARKAEEALRGQSATQRWLSDPQNAKVAHDDVENLTWWEKFFAPLDRTLVHQAGMAEQAARTAKGLADSAGLTAFAEHQVLSAEEGNAQLRLADASWRWMRGDRSSLVKATILGERQVLRGIHERKKKADVGPVTGVVGTVITQVEGPTGRILLSALEGALLGGAMGATAGAATGSKTGVKGGAVFGAGVGSKTLSFLESMKLEGALAFDEFRQLEGVTEDEALAAGYAVGLINGALEYAGFKRMARNIPGVDKMFKASSKQAVKNVLRNPSARRALTDLGKRVAVTGTAEGLTELLQEATIIVFGRTLVGKPYTEEMLKQDAARLGGAAKGGFTVGSVIGFGGSGTRYIMEMQQVRKAEQHRDVMVALGEKATESKLRERLPAKFREAVENATKDGPVTELYMPADQVETYFQGAVPDEAVRQELYEELGIAEQMAEALTQGGDITIPIATYAEKIAATEHHQTLLEHTRFRPDEMTPFQAKGADEVFNKTFEALMAEAKEAAETASRQSVPVENVRARILTMSEAAGLSPIAAKQSADLWAARARALQENYGVEDPEAFILGTEPGQFGLRIVAGKEGGALEQGSFGRLHPDTLPLTGEQRGALLEFGRTGTNKTLPKKIVSEAIRAGVLQEADRADAVAFLEGRADRRSKRQADRAAQGVDRLAIKRPGQALADAEQDKKYKTEREREARLAAIKKQQLEDISNLSGQELWSKKFAAEVARWVGDTVFFDAALDAVNKANMEAVPRILKKEGWTVRHASKDRSGRQSSRYLISPDRMFEVRLSDHHIPDTPQRDDARERFGGPRWDMEIVLSGHESPLEILAEIKSEKEQVEADHLDQMPAPPSSTDPDVVQAQQDLVEAERKLFEAEAQTRAALDKAPAGGTGAVQAVQSPEVDRLHAAEVEAREAAALANQRLSDLMDQPAQKELFQSAVPIQSRPLKIEGTGPHGRVTNWDFGEAVTARHMAKYGRVLDPAVPEDYNIIVRDLAIEYRNQIQEEDTGHGWYVEDIARAIETTKLIIPELADPVNRDLFLVITALLSPQQKPRDNWGNAILAMQGYLETGGTIALQKPSGKQFGVRSHTTGLQLLQHLIDEHGVEGAIEWVRSPHTGREMAEVRRASGLFKGGDQALPAKDFLASETNLTSEYLGIYMMGPKVGDFMMNATGFDHDAVTVDLWLARTYNRLIGRLLDVAPQLRENKQIASELRGKAERDQIKSLVRDVAERNGIDPSAMQAALWYFEQRLYRNHGINSDSQNFEGAARTAAEARSIAVPGAGEDAQRAGEATPGLVQEVRAGEPQTLEQPAYHGTPYYFDKFTLDHIGSGEGAQAYGWGLYFADREGVARYYRDALSAPLDPKYSPSHKGHTFLGQNARPIKFNNVRSVFVAKHLLQQAMFTGATIDEIVASDEQIIEAQRREPSLLQVVDPNISREEQESIDRAREVMAVREYRTTAEVLAGAGAVVGEAPTDKEGNLIKVEIPEAEDLLDWDKPLSQQSEKVRAAITNFFDLQGDPDIIMERLGLTDASSGKEFYQALSGITGQDRAASEALLKAGIPGLRYLDGSSRSKGEGTYNYVIWDEAAIEIVDRLEQATLTDKPAGPRASITFADTGTLIRLFENADLSSLLHEGGHLFLRETMALADTSAKAAEDLAVVRTFVGNTGGTFTVEQEETFARAFEAYLREGKAPSTALRAAFDRFKLWLTRIYKSVDDLHVELNDDIRAVFDGMLATREEIAEAEESGRYGPAFKSAEEMGVSEEAFAEYKRAADLASSVAEAELLRSKLAELAAAQKADRRAEVDKIRAEVEDEVNSRREYQALHYLTTGKWLVGDVPPNLPAWKLDRDVLVEMFGEDILQQLGRGFGRVYGTGEDAVHPDQVAGLFGYGTGEELVDALVGLEPRGKLISKTVQRRVRRRFSKQPVSGLGLAEEAIEAVHGDERLKFIEIELKALRARAGGGRRAVRAAAKKAAQQTLAGKSVADATRSQRFLMAERGAAAEAERAILAEDWETAAAAKHRQMLNHQLYVESRKVADEVDKIVRHAQRLQRKGVRNNIDSEYVDQIDSVLEGIELRHVSQKEAAKRVAAVDLLNWMEERQDEGFDVEIPDSVLRRAQPVPYTTLSLEALREVDTTVRHIEHLGRLKTKLIAAARRHAFEAVVDELVEAAEASGATAPDPPQTGRPVGAEYVDKVQDFMVMHIKPEFMYERLDGFKRGPWQRYLFQPFVDAENRETKMKSDYAKRLKKIMKARGQLPRRRTYIAETGRSWWHSELLAVALNTGNAYNRETLMEGQGWSEVELKAVLDKLSAKDWAWVQSVWDMIQTLGPEVFEHQKKMTGSAPEMVERVPFSNAHGDFAGGYFPVVYDVGRSWYAQQFDEKQKLSEMLGNNAARSTTRQGHTKARVGPLKENGRPAPLLLDPERVITKHLDEVIHDLTHRAAIIDAQRLLGAPRVKQAVETTLGRRAYKDLRGSIGTIASDSVYPDDWSGWAVRHLRNGASIVNMGLKLTTALVQPFGLTQSVALVGEKWMLKGMKQFLTHPIATSKFVLDSSEQMANRTRTFDRDARDFMRKTGLKGVALEVRQTWFILTGLMDMSVAIPTWFAAYKKAQNSGEGEHAEWVAAGDSAVRMSQGSGSAKDLSFVQRGPEIQRALTMFYAYYSSFHNMMAREKNMLLQRGPAHLPRFTANMVYLWFLVSVLPDMILGRGPDEDDEEGFWEWAGGKVAAYPLQGIVGIRDLASTIESGFDYQPSAIIDAISTNVDGISALVTKGLDPDEEMTDAEKKKLFIGMGYIFKLPTRQMYITYNAFMKHLEGEDVSLFELLVTGKKNE